MGTAKFNVYTGEPAGGAVPTAAQLGLEPPRFCARLRQADDRAGAARRLVGEVLPARHAGLARILTSDDIERCTTADFARARGGDGRRRPGSRRRRRSVRSWAWLAPPIHGVIALTKSGDRVHAALGAETDNFFNAAFLLVGLVVALAVVTAVLVWQWRPHRGPLLCAALAIGSAAAAGAAAGVGALIVRARYDVIDIAGAPISPEHRVHLRDRSARRCSSGTPAG